MASRRVLKRMTGILLRGFRSMMHLDESVVCQGKMDAGSISRSGSRASVLRRRVFGMRKPATNVVALRRRSMR